MHAVRFFKRGGREAQRRQKTALPREKLWLVLSVQPADNRIYLLPDSAMKDIFWYLAVTSQIRKSITLSLIDHEQS